MHVGSQGMDILIHLCFFLGKLNEFWFVEVGMLPFSTTQKQKNSANLGE
jgi:hypothetical protein